jgi:hypothetical protein
MDRRGRTVALSVIALSWLFLGGGSTQSAFAVKPSADLLLSSGALCLLAILTDYLQYVVGYFDSQRVLKKGETSGIKDYVYSYDASAHRWRRRLFWLKQILVVLGFIVFAWATVAALFPLAPSQPGSQQKSQQEKDLKPGQPAKKP